MKQFICNDLISVLCKSLLTFEGEQESFNLKNILHKNGINIRYLGLIFTSINSEKYKNDYMDSDKYKDYMNSDEYKDYKNKMNFFQFKKLNILIIENILLR